MLCDDHSNYGLLFAMADTSADNAARAIIDWSSAFEVSNRLMSDRPAHSRTKLSASFKRIASSASFMLPFYLWSNEAVVTLGK